MTGFFSYAQLSTITYISPIFSSLPNPPNLPSPSQPSQPSHFYEKFFLLCFSL